MLSNLSVNPPPPPFSLFEKLLAERRQVDFRSALHSYFVSLSRYIVSEHKERQKQLRRDRHMLQVRGEGLPLWPSNEGRDFPYGPQMRRGTSPIALK